MTRRNLPVVTLSAAFLCGFILLVVPEIRNAVLSQTCSTPLGQGANTAWPKDATVHVVIDPSFSPAEKAAITGQLSKWGNAGGSGVTFVEKTPSTAGPGAAGGGNPILFMSKEVPSVSTRQGETGGFTINGRRGDSDMKINPGVTDSTALTHTVSHELGHTFGLDDCPACPRAAVL